MSGPHKITIVGTSHVGMSMAALLAQHNEIAALDIDARRVELIIQRKQTVIDAETKQHLAETELSLRAKLDKE